MKQGVVTAFDESFFLIESRSDVRPHRMFLHAHKLILPNSVESLDLNAGDPFLEMESSFYEESEIVNKFDANVYNLYEDDTLPWKTVDS